MAEREVKQWITVNGNHIPIFEGESTQDAYNRAIAKHNESTKERQIRRAKEESDRLNNKPTSNSQIEFATRDTLASAYEYHRIHNNLTSVSADDVGKDFFKVNYGKVDTDIAKSIDLVIKDLSDKYDTTVSNVRLMDKSEFIGHKDSFAFTYHDYETDQSTLVINSAKCGSYDKCVSRVKELVDSGYAVQINSKNYDKYIVTHEFAHTLIDMKTPLNNKRNWVGADYAKIKRVRKGIEDLYKSYLSELSTLESEHKPLEYKFIMGDIDDVSMKKLQKLSNDISSLKLSKYSMNNSDEFMAEAFTLSQLGNSDNKYVKSVMKIIDDNFRRK